MTLQEVFEQLAYGELTHLKLGEFATDELQRKKVTAHIRLGLTELYKRFWLKQKDVVIQIYPAIEQYVLDSRFSVNSYLSPETSRYILDSVYTPFENDLLKIERVFNEVGEQQPLNDDYREESWFTPSYNILHKPVLYEDRIALVEYRANHPKIDPECDPCGVNLELPIALLEPLLLFVAHRASRTLNSDQNQESNNYLQQYEMACTRVKDLGYEVTPHRTNMKLDNHGWV
jgi:hypothetical protein